MQDVENKREVVTIVSGLPRSGTSLMMRMLEAGGMSVLIDGVREADPDNPRGYYEFEAVKRTKDDPTWLSAAQGKVVKMVYRLLYDLPADYRYKVVFMRRSLKEVIASQNVMLERRGERDLQLADEELVATFERELARFQDWIKGKPNFRMHEVSYNRLLSNADEQIRSLNDFLGGNLDTAAMSAVIDVSLYRNRK